MPVVVNCTSCGKALRVPDKYVGKETTCPVCKSAISVANSEGTSGLAWLPIAAFAIAGIALGFAGGVVFEGQFNNSEPVVKRDIPEPVPTPTPAASLADLVRQEKGIESDPPEDWRVVEGRILGIEGGMTALYPYLRGTYNTGLARSHVIDALKNEFPNMQIRDGSNAVTGELLTLIVEPDCQVIMYGTWQNIHLIVVAFAFPKSTLNARNISDFIIVAEKVAELSFHQDTIAEKVDSNWLHKALKESGRTKESVKRIV